MKKATKHFLLILSIGLGLSACNNRKQTPKPRGYFRIAFPEKSYHQANLDFPFTFDIANYSELLIDTDRNDDDWINIVTKKNKADLHITYVPLKNDLSRHLEESRKLAYDHAIKADEIEEQRYINPAEKVYGTIFFIEGNAASPIQFYLTDSSRHFLRGALYIREIPNIDSISPVIEFLKPDVIRLIETTQWK